MNKCIHWMHGLGDGVADTESAVWMNILISAIWILGFILLLHANNDDSNIIHFTWSINKYNFSIYSVFHFFWVRVHGWREGVCGGGYGSEDNIFAKKKDFVIEGG